MSGRAVCRDLLRVYLIAMLAPVLSAQRVAAHDGPAEPVNLAGAAYLPAMPTTGLIDSGEEGSSPFTSWIWTINGTERNILQIESMTWGSPRSRLAELIRSGHPDENGQPRVEVPDQDRRRVYLWIDLNGTVQKILATREIAQPGTRLLPPRDIAIAVRAREVLIARDPIFGVAGGGSVQHETVDPFAKSDIGRRLEIGG